MAAQLPLNLTPHPIKIIKKDREVDEKNIQDDDFVLIESQGTLRVAEKPKQAAQEFEWPFVVNEKTEYTEIDQFPAILDDPDHPGIIVSTIASEKIPAAYKGPVFIPDSGPSAIRDKPSGVITHIKSLSVVRKRNRDEECPVSPFANGAVWWMGVDKHRVLRFQIEDDLFKKEYIRHQLEDVISRHWFQRSFKCRMTRGESGVCIDLWSYAIGFDVDITFHYNDEPIVDFRVILDENKLDKLEYVADCFDFLLNEPTFERLTDNLKKAYCAVAEKFRAKIKKASETASSCRSCNGNT